MKELAMLMNTTRESMGFDCQDREEARHRPTGQRNGQYRSHPPKMNSRLVEKVSLAQLHWMINFGKGNQK